MVKKISRWIPPVLWGILLAVLSLMPPGQTDFFLFGIPFIDKIGHFGMYAIWTFLVFLAWKGNSFLSDEKVMWLTFIFGTLTGAGLELVQNTMFIGRTFEFWDMIANGAGSLAGAFSGYIFAKKITTK